MLIAVGLYCVLWGKCKGVEDTAEAVKGEELPVKNEAIEATQKKEALALSIPPTMEKKLQHTNHPN